jgi:hypothetical protein
MQHGNTEKAKVFAATLELRFMGHVHRNPDFATHVSGLNSGLNSATINRVIHSFMSLKP